MNLKSRYSFSFLHTLKISLLYTIQIFEPASMRIQEPNKKLNKTLSANKAWTKITITNQRNSLSAKGYSSASATLKRKFWFTSRSLTKLSSATFNHRRDYITNIVKGVSCPLWKFSLCSQNKYLMRSFLQDRC